MSDFGDPTGSSVAAGLAVRVITSHKPLVGPHQGGDTIARDVQSSGNEKKMEKLKLDCLIINDVM